MKRNPWVGALLAFLVALAFVVIPALLCGCKPSISPEAKSEIKKIDSDAAVAAAQTKVKADAAARLAKQKSADALAKATADAKLHHEQGAEMPLTHPAAALNNFIVDLHRWLLGIFSGAFVAWIILFGLSKSPLAILKTIAGWLCPVLRWIWVLSLAGMAALLVLPWGILFVLVAVAGLLIYELVKNKGNVKATATDIETDIDDALMFGEHATKLVTAPPPVITITKLGAAPAASAPAGSPATTPAPALADPPKAA